LGNYNYNSDNNESYLNSSLISLPNKNINASLRNRNSNFSSNSNSDDSNSISSNGIFPIFIKYPIVGYFARYLRPFVEKMPVSIMGSEIYSLECDLDTFDSNNMIGSFIGYPGIIVETNGSPKLKLGLKYAYGYIQNNNGSFMKVENGKTSEYNNDLTNNPNNSNNANLHLVNRDDGIIVPTCTSAKYRINENCDRVIENCDRVIGNISNNNICGTFSGIPGKYVLNQNYNANMGQNNFQNQRYTRVYGKNYANGIIELDGIYKFRYALRMGNLCEINPDDEIRILANNDIMGLLTSSNGI
jgi:hypothetical protein